VSRERVPVAVVRTPHGSEPLPLPRYMSERASGMDLLADIEADIVLAPGERRLVPTGLTLAIPPGYEGQVRPRSGFAMRHGVTVLNAPGTIDSDFRGHVQVLLVNHGTAPVTLRRGQGIAQLVIAPVATAVWEEVATLPPTGRGAGGFGSTDGREERK